MFLFCACTQRHSNHKTELAALRLEAAEPRARYLRILAESADIRMELIHHLKRQALEKVDYPGRPKSAYPMLAFARLAKAGRQTRVLESTLGRMRLLRQSRFRGAGMRRIGVQLVF